MLDKVAELEDRESRKNLRFNGIVEDEHGTNLRRKLKIC